MSSAFKVRPLILCPDCKREMRLFGIEPESEIRDVFTFECNGWQARSERRSCRSALFATNEEPEEMIEAAN